MNNEKEGGILGYIELESGKKPVKPMNDTFLNFTYSKQENWETLRLKANIFYEDYISNAANTRIKPIVGDIKVDTQYEYLLDEEKTTKRQDFKMTTIKNNDDKEYNYIEFNNTAPEALRGVEYYGLGSGHSGGKPSHQLWLVGEGTNKIFERGEGYAEYLIKNKVTNKELDIKSTMLFVNLKALSKNQTKAGELASVLIGKSKEPKYKEVEEIFKTLTNNFEKFKADKGAKNRMTVAERYTERGIDIGIEQGIEILIKSQIRAIGTADINQTWQKGYFAQVGIELDKFRRLFEEVKNELNQSKQKSQENGRAG